jgi:hypothetical protein
LISYGLKPVWLKRLFVTVIPFLCLFAALAVRKQLALPWSVARVRSGLALGLIVVWVGTGIAGQLTREKGDGYKPAAAYLRQTLAPGDAVLVDGDYLYWCFLWYFAGPDWGVPQQAYIETPKWAEFVSHLSPSIVGALDFREQKRDIKVRGSNVIMWDRQNSGQIPVAPRIFVVRNAAEASLAFSGYDLTVTRPERNLAIDEFRRAKAD